MRVKKGEYKIWLKIQHSKNKDHGIWSYHFMKNRWNESGNSGIFYIQGVGYNLTVNSDCSHKIKRHLLLGKKAITNLAAYLKAETSLFDKGPYSQSYVQTCMDVRVEP